MEDIKPETKAYIDSSVFLLKQLKQMLRNHNRMLSVSAMVGDVPSASMLLHNNVAISSIDVLMEFPIVKEVFEEIESELKESTTPPMDVN